MVENQEIIELRTKHRLCVRAMRREILLTVVVGALLPLLRLWPPIGIGFSLILFGMLLCFVCLDLIAVRTARSQAACRRGRRGIATALDAPALRRVGLGHLAGGDSPRGSPWNGCGWAAETLNGVLEPRPTQLYG